MTLDFISALITLNTKTGGRCAASRCLWQALRDSLI